MPATDYDFILTRNELIQLAHRKVGVLADGDTLTGEQLAFGVQIINGILKAWNNDGIMLWTELRETISAVDGDGRYSIPTTNGMAYVDTAYVVENSREIPLQRLNTRQYKSIEDKAHEGQPDSFYVDYATSEVVFWPVPDGAYTIYIDGVRKLKDWESASSTGDLPGRWQEAIKYALVAQLAEDFLLPIREREYYVDRANGEYARARLGERDRADSDFVKGAY